MIVEASFKSNEKADFLRFLLIGSFGFVVDVAVLIILSHWGVMLYFSRLISFGAASAITWILNRTINFHRDRSRPKGAEYVKYMLVQTIGAGINMAIFLCAIWQWPSLQGHLVVPLFLGAACAFTFNFMFSRKFVFKAVSP